jgi:CRISPR-associated Csx3 family protein
MLSTETTKQVMSNVVIDVKTLYGEQAKLVLIPDYESKVLELAGNGNDVTLTGAGPVWLYLRLAHVLHGKCRSLSYDSPVTGAVVVFDHNPL